MWWQNVSFRPWLLYLQAKISAATVQKADGILEAVWTHWGREIEPQFLSCLARSVVIKPPELPWLILSYIGQPNI